MFLFGKRKKIVQAMEHHKRAGAYFEAGNFDAAITEYNAALAVFPLKKSADIQTMEKEAREFKAEIHNNLGAAYSRKALALSEQDPRRRGFFEKALAEYLEILFYNLDNMDAAEAHNNIGACYEHLGDLEAAIRYRQIACELNLNYPESWVNLGNCYLHQGWELKSTDPFNAQEKFGRARIAYANAIDLRDDYAEAYYSRALAYSNLGNFADAIADYDISIRYRSNQLRKMQRALDANPGTYIDHLKYNQARGVLIKSYQNCGFQYQEQGNHNKAIEYFINAIICGGENQLLALSHSSLGISLAKSERKDQAIAQFKKAVELYPGFEDALHNIKCMETGMGNLLDSRPRYNI